jgi:hypothetical protein
LTGIGADLKIISERLGWRIALGKLNSSDHKPYRDYYADSKVREKVEEIYGEDIGLFGYEY